MAEDTLNGGGLTTAQRVATIRAAVQQAGDGLRARHPWLARNDLIAGTILFASLAGMVLSGYLYLHGVIAWWLCIPLSALCASWLHELEHDLIHRLYFRRWPLAQQLTFALLWLARPSTVNPWIRRRLHLNHHKFSGQASDLEERGITNGQPWGLARLLMVGDNILAIVIPALRRRRWADKLRLLALGLAGYFPLGWLNWGCWYVFLGFHAADGLGHLLGHPVAWSAATLSWMAWVDAATVVLVAPNVLRTYCLHTISSNMHYYGDVEEGNLLQQTQVLNPWWLWPLQLFCFNFGSTHAIHHFVVGEPFYIRQLTARPAHAVMRAMGVRFNDLATFRRANRYRPQAASEGIGAERAAAAP
jgi:fatty acid desaturase